MMIYVIIASSCLLVIHCCSFFFPMCGWLILPQLMQKKTSYPPTMENLKV